jgi:hypothetical protein
MVEMMRRVEINRFDAKSQSGKLYTIIEYQEQVSATGFGNPNNIHKGLKSWVTSEEQSVNQIDSETYQILGTNEIVRKIF